MKNQKKKPRHAAVEIYLATTTTTVANKEYNSKHLFKTTTHQSIRTLELAATQKRIQQ